MDFIYGCVFATWCIFGAAAYFDELKDMKTEFWQALMLKAVCGPVVWAYGVYSFLGTLDAPEGWN